MNAAEIIAKLVDELADKVLATVGPTPKADSLDDAGRHVLKLRISKLVADHLQRAAAV
jgi:hypothetical protein